MGTSAQQRSSGSSEGKAEKALAGGEGGRLRRERPLETAAVSVQKIWWWDQLYPVDGDLIRRRISKRSGLKSKGLRMGASFIPLIIFTIIFAVVAILLPIFVPKNPYRGVVQVSLFLTGTCMWFFWIFTYMTQMNPLIGPILNQRALIAVKNYWGDAWQDEV